MMLGKKTGRKRNMNLLILDDEEIEVELINALVKTTGIEFEHIYKTYCMEEAISILKRKKISIVICDIEMPGGSGHDLTEWIRNRNMEVEVIFSTGHAEFDYATMALHLGVSDYLLKPVKKEKLKEALQKAMKNNPQTQTNHPNEMDASMIVSYAKSFIKNHCEEPLNREQMAKHYHISPSYFSKIFREYTSMSLREYISFVRMEKAKELLLYTNKSISDIATETGHSSTAYFIKQFKQEMQMTPKQYRKISGNLKQVD